MSLLVLFALFGSALADTTWISCSQEYQLCYPSNYTDVLLRFGKGTQWTYLYASNPQFVNCTDGTFGDPFINTVKQCDYQPLKRGGEPHQFTYTYCAKEGSTCKFSGTRWVRFGTPGRYFYRIAKGGIGCTDNYFGDPDYGYLKSCAYSAHEPVWVYKDNQTFCADEGKACSFPSGSQHIYNIQYGAKGQPYVYHQLSGESVTCSNAAFDDPSPGVAKDCYIFKNAFQFEVSKGQWKKVGSCTNCTEMDSQMEVGIRSDAPLSLANPSLQQSIQRGFDFNHVLQSYARSTKTLAAMKASGAFSKKDSFGCAGTCSRGSKGTLTMWQWEVKAGEICIYGVCPITVDACAYVCRDTDSPPACPLGSCLDKNCNTCL